MINESGTVGVVTSVRLIPVFCGKTDAGRIWRCSLQTAVPYRNFLMVVELSPVCSVESLLKAAMSLEKSLQILQL